MHCVLVADDSQPFAEMLRATLEDAGFEVVTAYSGLAAVAAMEHNDVSIAVLDVLMPGISGDAVAHRLQQLDPNLPVLLMTGADGAYAATSGVPVLRKPFPHEELVAAVRRLVK
jgi:DNA-binding response OmpR family regulator